MQILWHFYSICNNVTVKEILYVFTVLFILLEYWLAPTACSETLSSNLE
jgi:hypothetical protein